MNKNLLVFLLGISCLVACKKIILPEEKDIASKTTFDDAKGSFSATPTSSSAMYRGLYLDSTSYILGDSVKENKVLKWCVANKITTITYYDLHRIMDLGKADQLANFLKRARTSYGIKENSAAVSSSYYVTSVIDTFNNARADTLKRFNWCNLEIEWWNNETTFSDYITKLAAIKAWGVLQTPKVRTEEYIGWFDNPSGQDSLMASSLLQNSDRILVHDYYASPSWAYIQNRIDYIGRAAFALGKTARVVPIFDASTGVTGTYFQTSSFDSAYQTVINGYASSTIPKKASVDILGYQLFSYSEAKAARPLPNVVNFTVNNSPSKPLSGQIRIYDNTNQLIDMQTFSGNTNTLKALKQPSSWKLEIDATNGSAVRYIMEIYINGTIADYYYISAGATRTVMKVPYPSGYHNLSGNVTLSFYPN